jgi:hypothetical protein
MAVITKIKWEDADFTWDTSVGKANYESFTGHPLFTWDEVFLVDEAVEEIKGGSDEDALHFNQWDEPKKRCLIKLVCKVQGIEYKKEKECKDYKITVKDIKILYKEINGVELTTENISF